MMKTLDLSGPILDDDSFDAVISNAFGMAYISPKVVQNALDEAGNSPITFNINSGGGSVSAASAISDKLKHCKNEITTNISGMAASAASVIAMAGDKVTMAETAILMIHNASSIAQGNNHDMQHAADVLSKINETIANSYVSKTGKSKDEILDLMDKESWIDAEEAKEKGFIDEIYTNTKVVEPITNSVDGSIFSASIKDKFQQFNSFQELFGKLNEFNEKSSSKDTEKDRTPVPVIDKHQELINKKLKILKG